ncbi:MAG TPA: hypothetical protein VF450_24800 [Noviherbaspirillum sp.]
MKRISVSFFAVLLSFAMALSIYGLFGYAVHQLKTAGNKHIPANNKFVLVVKALRHLPLSSLISNEEELGLILAYHTLHAEQKEYVLMMENAGLALKGYQEVFEKSRSSGSQYAKDALLEIVGLLVRIPWDDQLQDLATNYANELNAEISQKEVADEDLTLAHELLALYFSRTGAIGFERRHVEIADHLDRTQSEDVLASAIIFMRKARLSLASCIHGTPTTAVWTEDRSQNTQRATSHEYLKGEYYHAWDIALVKTVMFSSKQDTCQNLARDYQSLFGFK